MPRAYSLIRTSPHYRHEAFVAGLRRAGYAVTQGFPDRGAPGDVMVIWNRYGIYERNAERFEGQGGTVLVAENGYWGKDAGGVQYYALARRGHNGSGWWPDGGRERLDRLGIELKPWRADGGHILICAQRGIGSRTMASPMDWHNTAARRLRALTKREIVVRPHPEDVNLRGAKLPPLEEQMRGAWAVVVWSSTSGVKALLEGIPVLYDAPHWICSGAAARLDSVKAPFLGDRLPALQRMAWAQWTVAEIASGEPFRLLVPGAQRAAA